MILKFKAFFYRFFLYTLCFHLIPIASCAPTTSLPENPSIDELKLALTSADSNIRKQAAAGLGDLGPAAEIAIPELAKALNDSDFYVSRMAAQALGSIGTKTLPALKTSLLEPEGKYSYNALVALRLIGERAIPVLVEILSQPNGKFRIGAAEVLGKIGPKATSAVPELTKALKDPNSRMRTVAAETLGRIGPAAKTATPTLAEMLKDPDQFVRQSAADALGSLTDPSATDIIPTLIDALADSNSWVRARSALALGKIGPGAKTAIPALIRTTEDSFSRASAIEALGKIGSGSHKVFPAIETALQDSDEMIKRYAVIAIGNVGTASPDCVRELLKLLDTPDIPLRSDIENSLYKIGPSVAPALISDLNDSDAKVRAGAAETLRKLGQLAVAELSRALDESPSETRQPILSVLCDIGPEAKEALPALVRALKDDNPDVRRKSIETIGNIGNTAQAAIPELTKLLSDTLPANRESAQEVLNKLATNPPQMNEQASDGDYNQKLTQEIYEKAERMLSEKRNFKDVAAEYRKAALLSPEQTDLESDCEECGPSFGFLAREKYEQIEKFMSWTGSPSGEPGDTSTLKYLNRDYMQSEEFLKLLVLRPEWVLANTDWLAISGNLPWHKVQEFMEQKWKYSLPTPIFCENQQESVFTNTDNYRSVPSSEAQNYIDCYLREAPKTEENPFKFRRVKRKRETAQSCLFSLTYTQPREDILQLFIDARKHPKLLVRSAAYLGIANFNPDNAMELLQPGLEDSASDLSCRVLTYIIQLKDVRSVELLSKNSPTHYVQRQPLALLSLLETPLFRASRNPSRTTKGCPD
ncbi:MAG: HEAT repeat domain-containing protein [Elusimicrobia bacterium]|nr:HEAT repeat domain-containing protein [Elusimicrobiota bacterium]